MYPKGVFASIIHSIKPARQLAYRIKSVPVIDFTRIYWNIFLSNFFSPINIIIFNNLRSKFWSKINLFEKIHSDDSFD